jgi:hypothetical protein
VGERRLVEREREVPLPGEAVQLGRGQELGDIDEGGED